MDMYIITTPKAKEKMVGKIAWGHRATIGTIAGGMFLPQTLQNETGRHQDILS
jgi:hypothetical protein